jgi:pre-mRNA-splicing factor CWC22
LVFLAVIFWPDIFKFDSNFLENEEKYKEIKAEILGEDSSEEESGSESDSEDDEGTLAEAIYTRIV